MPQTPPHPHEFLPTRWTLVLAAKLTDTRAARALEDLARAYWYPLYAFARRQLFSPEHAEDVIQSFFTVLIEYSGTSFYRHLKPDRLNRCSRSVSNILAPAFGAIIAHFLLDPADFHGINMWISQALSRDYIQMI